MRGKWKLPLVCVFVLIMATLMPACMSAEEHFEKGKTYFDAGQLEEAITEYSQAIELDPEYALAYHHRGIAYAKKEQWDLAIADGTKAIELDPNIELDPQYALAYNSRGIAYAKKGQWDSAITDYTKVIELDPNFAPAYGNRGVAYAKKGQWDLAIADYSKAMELNPNYPPNYHHRGTAYDKKGQWDLAIADYTKLISDFPDAPLVAEARNALPRCHYEWALSLFREGQYHDANEKCGVIKSQYPNSTYASKVEKILKEYSLLENALKYQQDKEYDAAINEYKSLMSQYPDSIFAPRVNDSISECYHEWALYLVQKKQYAEALNKYETVVEDYPDSSWASKENAKTICEPVMFRGKRDEKKEATVVLAKACNADVNELLPYLQQKTTVIMYYALLKIGDPTTIEVLKEALNKFGNKDMAVDYLNCGNEELESAAESWARRHGYRVVTVSGYTPRTWGTGL